MAAVLGSVAKNWRIGRRLRPTFAGTFLFPANEELPPAVFRSDFFRRRTSLQVRILLGPLKEGI